MKFTNALAQTLVVFLTPVLAASDDSSILGSMKSDANGVFHLADDGVVRSYAADLKTVIDYKPLSSADIQEVLSHYSGDLGSHYHQVFDGVDGHDVINMTQILDPPTSLRPVFNPSTFLSSGVSDNTGLSKRVTACNRGCQIHNDCTRFSCTDCLYVDAVSGTNGGQCFV